MVVAGLMVPARLWLVAFSVTVVLAAPGAAQDETARILKPKEGTVVDPVSSLTVEVLVKGLTSGRGRNFHYWVSLGESDHGRVGRFHWPRFRVRGELDKETISNSISVRAGKPKEEMILILRVDDATNIQFEEWLDSSKKTGHLPGLPLNSNQIIARTVVYLPDS